MRKIDGTFYRTDEISRESTSCPNWLSQFAEQAALQEIIAQPSQIKTASKTAVEVMRERQPSVYEMMSAIVSKQKPKYSSVEEAVKDYQKRTGLTDYLQKNKSTLSLIAQNIITEASAKDTEDDSDPKGSSDFVTGPASGFCPNCGESHAECECTDDDFLAGYDTEDGFMDAPLDQDEIDLRDYNILRNRLNDNKIQDKDCNILRKILDKKIQDIRDRQNGFKIDRSDPDSYLSPSSRSRKDDNDCNECNKDNEKVMKKNPLEGTDLESYLIGRWHSHDNKKNNTSTDLESILEYLGDTSKEEEDNSDDEDGNFDIDKLFNYINQLSPEQPKIIVLEVSSDDEEDSDEDDKKEDTDDVRWDDKKKSLVAEGQSVEDDVPEILKNFPAIKGYIVNIIDTNYGIQVPAVLHSIVETFGRDGINQQIFSDKELMSWINKILIEKRHSTEATPMQLGRGVGIQQEFSGSKNSDDPFSLLSPNKGSY